MKRTYKILGGIVIVTSLGLATAVYANSDGAGHCMGGGAMGGMSGMNGTGGMAGMGGHMMERGHGHFDPAAMIDGRLAYLKSALKITGAQETAWQAFSAKARQQGETMQAMHAAMSSQTAAVSAPERMAQHEAMMKRQLGNMEAMDSALKGLYSVLTPEQKAIADQSFGRMHMAFGGH